MAGRPQRPQLDSLIFRNKILDRKTIEVWTREIKGELIRNFYAASWVTLVQPPSSEDSLRIHGRMAGLLADSFRQNIAFMRQEVALARDDAARKALPESERPKLPTLVTPPIVIPTVSPDKVEGGAAFNDWNDFLLNGHDLSLWSQMTLSHFIELGRVPAELTLFIGDQLYALANNRIPVAGNVTNLHLSTTAIWFYCRLNGIDILNRQHW